MPYITHEAKVALHNGLPPKSAGELNFLITNVCLNYLNIKRESYAAYNDIIGALECTKLEMYRRRIASYEDRKRAANGDVFE